MEDRLALALAPSPSLSLPNLLLLLLLLLLLVAACHVLGTVPSVRVANLHMHDMTA